MKTNLYYTVINNDGIIGLSVDRMISCPEHISTAKAVVDLFEEAFPISRFSEEYVYILCMDKNSVPLGIFELAHGIVRTDLISARDAFKKMLLLNAASFVVVHNDLKNFCVPSGADDTLYDTLHFAGELMDVRAVDLIILGRAGRYYSYSEHGVDGERRKCYA